MCPLQDVKQSGFEATLLVDPVNDVGRHEVAVTLSPISNSFEILTHAQAQTADDDEA